MEMEIARHWRLRKQKLALAGEVCPHCEAKIFPPRGRCPECNNNGKLSIESPFAENAFPVDMFIAQAVLAQEV